ncbi:T9SS type A sorting domain-containing protein [Flavisolibacter sp. BT320]|nr:T9SS type A sorting domain-containing protein [Flavisolibacter longurius]
MFSENAVFEEGRAYTFYLDPNFFLNNENISIQQIRIDFGDGQGEWVVNNPFGGGNQRNNSVFSSITKVIGKVMIGRIIVVGIDLLGHVIEHGNPFKILGRKTKEAYPLTLCKGGGRKWVIEPDPVALAAINNQYGNPTPYPRNIQVVRTGSGLFDFTVVPAKDTAYFFFNDNGDCSTKPVRRPVIFIDGFDPANDRKVGDIYKDYINVTVDRSGFPGGIGLGDYMLNNGNTDPNDDLEFIILDFKHGNDLLERNAMTLVALIKRLNETYGSQYLQDITVIGPSMGSLIAQYALAYMEHNGITHRVKTYISFDGCHQGANVPIGLQNFVEYVTRRGLLKGMKPIREGMYNGLAAKQMLAHHHSANSQFPAPDALRTQFLQNLAAVGEYPQNPRNVALINGAKNGIINPNFPTTNLTLLDIQVRRGGLAGLCGENICKKIKWKARTTTNSGTNQVSEMWTASPLYNLLFWVPLGARTSYADAAWGNSSLDNAPGGLFGENFSEDLETHGTFLAKEMIYLLTGDQPSFNINLNNFTFMPSYSAADLRFPTKNLYMRWDDQYLCGKTPFDYVYAPLENQRHVKVTQEGSIWFESEARCDASVLPVFSHIAGPDYFCNTETYTLETCTPTNFNITWEASPNRVVNISPNGSQVTLTKRNSGTVKLTAKNIDCNGNSITLFERSITVGAQPPSIIGPYDINRNTVMGVAYVNKTYYFTPLETSTFFPALGYTWTLFPPTGNPTLYGGSKPYIMFSETGYHTLQVAKNTDCGVVTSSILVNVQQELDGFRMAVAPNPVTGDVLNVTITDETASTQAIPADGDMSVELFELNSTMKRKEWKVKNHQKQFALNVGGLAKGIYILRVTRGNKQQSKQVIVQ